MIPFLECPYGGTKGHHETDVILGFYDDARELHRFCHCIITFAAEAQSRTACLKTQDVIKAKWLKIRLDALKPIFEIPALQKSVTTRTDSKQSHVGGQRETPARPVLEVQSLGLLFTAPRFPTLLRS